MSRIADRWNKFQKGFWDVRAGAFLVGGVVFAGLALGQVSVPACLEDVPGMACDKFKTDDEECPDFIYQDGTCTSVKGVASGLSSSQGYDRDCEIAISVPDGQGGCDTQPAVTLTARCKEAIGSACGGGPVVE